MNEKKRRFPFSVADLILILLVAACILSAIFAPRIRSFLGESDLCEAEVTFLVENVTAGGRNHPVAGETLYLEGGVQLMGSILSVTEDSTLFESVENPDDRVTLSTLTCRAKMQLERTESGLSVGGVAIKNGSRMIVETETAGFEMTVINVKELA